MRCGTQSGSLVQPRARSDDESTESREYPPTGLCAASWDELSVVPSGVTRHFRATSRPAPALRATMQTVCGPVGIGIVIEKPGVAPVWYLTWTVGFATDVGPEATRYRPSRTAATVAFAVSASGSAAHPVASKPPVTFLTDATAPIGSCGRAVAARADGAANRETDARTVAAAARKAATRRETCGIARRFEFILIPSAQMAPA